MTSGPARTRLAAGLVDARGVVGQIGATDDGDSLRVRGPDGPWFVVPHELLEEAEGSLRLRCTFAELAAGIVSGAAVVIPLAEESVRIARRLVDTGGVRVHVRVTEVPFVAEETVREQRLDVERVPDDRLVDAPLAPWDEGDVTCIPVQEEELVVVRRIRVREVVRIRRVETTAPRRIETTLQKEVVEIAPRIPPRDEPPS
jgi:stress response protein YsnF